MTSTCTHIRVSIDAMPQATKATEDTDMGVMVHVSVGRLLLICNIQVWFSNPDKEDRLLQAVWWTSE